MEQSSGPRRLTRTTDIRQSVLWIELNLADVVLTIFALSLGFSEGNSFLRLFVHDTGFFIFYRVVTTLAVLALTQHFAKMQYLRWLNIGMGAIVFWGVIWLGLYIL